MLVSLALLLATLVHLSLRSDSGVISSNKISFDTTLVDIVSSTGLVNFDVFDLTGHLTGDAKSSEFINVQTLFLLSLLSVCEIINSSRILLRFKSVGISLRISPESS